MKSYIIKQLLQGILLVVSVSILVFSLLYMMPGNPVDMVVDRKVSAEKKAEIAHEMGYDRPLLEQYVDWAKGIIFERDFGTSTRYKVPVWDLMMARTGTT
ncbi:ABC transporter permease [uncultured Intestinimonas sp.]|uniref:ABC transporter permease n=1 Tax=uncultured Intestinimonas sp. TaxID=1689265 RepID=UPI0025D47801|nr:ABC transporter permease [uncultured Intestinimonas sp.]